MPPDISSFGNRNLGLDLKEGGGVSGDIKLTRGGQKSDSKLTLKPRGCDIDGLRPNKLIDIDATRPRSANGSAYINLDCTVLSSHVTADADIEDSNATVNVIDFGCPENCSVLGSEANDIVDVSIVNDDKAPKVMHAMSTHVKVKLKVSSQRHLSINKKNDSDIKEHIRTVAQSKSDFSKDLEVVNVEVVTSDKNGKNILKKLRSHPVKSTNLV